MLTHDYVIIIPIQVLNAHMDSLQWIDSNAAAVERKLQDVTRLAEIHKR